MSPEEVREALLPDKRMLALIQGVNIFSAVGYVLDHVQNDFAIAIFACGLTMIACLSWRWISGLRWPPLVWRGVLLVSFALVLGACTTVLTAEPDFAAVTLEQPTEGSTVAIRAPVTGSVDEPKASVYVVVRPAASQDFWIQEAALVDADGQWRVDAYFGNDNTPKGERFDVLALAIHENSIFRWLTGTILAPGQVTRLPESANRSNIVTVVRE